MKFYRFLADIANDAAFMLDVLSPSLPAYARIPALCTASACRAVCGVCGGSSKAILSAHFARAGNIGELNAKDGSQETVVSLVGMWAGGIVVSRVEGATATWVWMMGLLVVHLWANRMAVWSVRLKTLNRGRAGMVFERLLEGRRDVSVEDVGREENLFVGGDAIRLQGEIEGYCTFVGLEELLASLKHSLQLQKRSEKEEGTLLSRLLQVFEGEEYLLWLDGRSSQVLILLKVRATTETQVKAWCHAVRLTHLLARFKPGEKSALDIFTETLQDNGRHWKEWKSQLEESGWDIANSVLAVSAGSRIQVDIN